jgi:hypothetical protein
MSGDAIMRSYLMTAALAATLLSTSLTLGYAASPGKLTTPAEASMKTGVGNETNGASTQMPASKVYPAKPAAYHVMQYKPRLSKIVAELGAATRRIERDRHHGYLTAAEARKVRSEEAAIRTAAISAASKHGGQIPEARFVSLQERVTDLNRNIHRYATNSARA